MWKKKKTNRTIKLHQMGTKKDLDPLLNNVAQVFRARVVECCQTLVELKSFI